MNSQGRLKTARTCMRGGGGQQNDEAALFEQQRLRVIWQCSDSKATLQPTLAHYGDSRIRPNADARRTFSV
ncbi:hypothetical protein [Burkholderia sp. ABCPW 14]|uniref:hypothetical protein n=1 Tax=Burkholderia sp. ABCPW 14 TaxID=1637860 RepID=UPI0012E3A60E|nr:hypothetical protein [Burkholderia sp. ABCPW 14]